MQVAASSCSLQCSSAYLQLEIEREYIYRNLKFEDRSVECLCLLIASTNSHSKAHWCYKMRCIQHNILRKQCTYSLITNHAGVLASVKTECRSSGSVARPTVVMCSELQKLGGAIA